MVRLRYNKQPPGCDKHIVSTLEMESLEVRNALPSVRCLKLTLCPWTMGVGSFYFGGGEDLFSGASGHFPLPRFFVEGIGRIYSMVWIPAVSIIHHINNGESTSWLQDNIMIRSPFSSLKISTSWCFFHKKKRGHHDLGAKHIEELGCKDVALRFPGLTLMNVRCGKLPIQ